ncbi:GD13126 [Drosophila simulans]|uniref:GD13126 n=1 Tax=Drosophila simulans TaxID=7240 RepID=B4QJE1_DROSI|nr:GD13126 [Drosophila simulans]
MDLYLDLDLDRVLCGWATLTLQNSTRLHQEKRQLLQQQPQQRRSIKSRSSNIASQKVQLDRISGGSAAGVGVDNNIATADRLAMALSFPARSVPLVAKTGLRMLSASGTSGVENWFRFE